MKTYCESISPALCKFTCRIHLHEAHCKSGIGNVTFPHIIWSCSALKELMSPCSSRSLHKSALSGRNPLKYVLLGLLHITFQLPLHASLHPILLVPALSLLLELLIFTVADLQGVIVWERLLCLSGAQLSLCPFMRLPSLPSSHLTELR